VGEHRGGSDCRQPGQRRGPLAPLAAPRQSHIHLLLGRRGAGSGAAEGSAESPLAGPARSPLKQSLALSLPPFNQLLLRTDFRAATPPSCPGLKTCPAGNPRTPPQPRARPHHAARGSLRRAPRVLLRSAPSVTHAAYLVTGTDMLLVFYFTDSSEFK